MVLRKYLVLFSEFDHNLLLNNINSSVPFDIAIVFFIIMIIFIWQFWPENYGTRETKATTSFITAIQILRSG